MGAQPLALVGEDESGAASSDAPGARYTPRTAGPFPPARLFERVVRVRLVAAAWNFQPAPRTVFRPPARRALAPRRCFSSTLSLVNSAMPPAARAFSVGAMAQISKGPTATLGESKWTNETELESHTGSAGICRVPESLERLLLTDTQQTARTCLRVDCSQPTPAQLPGSSVSEPGLAQCGRLGKPIILEYFILLTVSDRGAAASLCC